VEFIYSLFTTLWWSSLHSFATTLWRSFLHSQYVARPYQDTVCYFHKSFNTQSHNVIRYRYASSNLGVLASLLSRAQGSSLHIETHIDPLPACDSTLTLNKRESVVLWMFPRRDVINGPSPKRSDNVRTRNVSRVSGPFASGTPYSSLTSASHLYKDA
jgi:hypothetical protein